MISNERLIVILGMAQSGTTILAHTLAQHPEIVCCASGGESWKLENDLLSSRNSDSIQELLATHPDKRILLKRPWNEVFHAAWMLDNMPAARFLYCWRPFPLMAYSWSRPHRLKELTRISAEITNRFDYGIEHYQEIYDKALAKAEEFGKKTQHFHKITLSNLVEHGQCTMNECVEWLDLTPYQFDLSEVSYDKDIKTLLLGKNSTSTLDKE